MKKNRRERNQSAERFGNSFQFNYQSVNQSINRLNVQADAICENFPKFSDFFLNAIFMPGENLSLNNYSCSPIMVVGVSLN
jgi:hypothetical protein